MKSSLTAILFLLSLKLIYAQNDLEYQLGIKDVNSSEYNLNYCGVFLPDDSWMVFEEYDGSKFFQDTRTSLKQFKKGTFHNRFSKTNFLQFIKNKGYVFLGYLNNQQFDKFAGKVGFIAYNNKKEKRYLCSYNFTTDELIEISEISSDDTKMNNGEKLPLHHNFTNTRILEYNGFNDQFIIVKSKFQDPDEYDYSDVYTIYITSKNGRKEVEGEFLSVIFSKSGKYLLGLTTKREIKIFESSTGKTVYSKLFEYPLITKPYSHKPAIAIENDNFYVEYSIASPYDKINDKVEYTEYVYTLQLKNKLYVESDHIKKEHENELELKIRRAVSKNVENQELLKKITNYITNSPITDLSLNSDSSKMLANLESGGIALVDLNTMKNLVCMYFITDSQHIFYSSDGEYFSNTDPENFLYAKKGKQTFNLGHNSNTNLYDPVSILEYFGKPDKQYLEALNRAIQIRKSVLKNYIIEDLKIEDVKWSKNNKNGSETNFRRLSIILTDDSKMPNSFDVKINNVPQLNLEFKKISDKTFDFEVPLISTKNVLEIIAKDGDSASFPFKKNVYLNRDSEIEKDLYVLSIGVSKYKQTNYNLTFADKDALDIARTYGKFSDARMDDYVDRFFKQPYLLKNASFNSQTVNLRYNKLTYNVDTGIAQPISNSGRYWLEPREDSSYLWDFKNGSIEKFNPNNAFCYGGASWPDHNHNHEVIGGSEIIKDVNPNECFYTTIELVKDAEYELAKLYSYNFITKESKLIKDVPFVNNYQSALPIKNNRWLINMSGYSEYSKDYLLKNKYPLDQGNLYAGIKKSTELNIRIYSYHDGLWNYDDYNLKYPKKAILYDSKILKVSNDGNSILVHFGTISDGGTFDEYKYKYGIYKKRGKKYVLNGVIKDEPNNNNWARSLPDNPDQIYLSENSIKILVQGSSALDYVISPHADKKNIAMDIVNWAKCEDFTYEDDSEICQKLYEVDWEDKTYIVSLDFNGYAVKIEDSPIKSLYWDSDELWTFDTGELIYIEKGKNLASNYDSPEELRTSIERSERKPASFKNTYVKTLVNEQATAQEIKKELQNFLKGKRPQDQIIVFIAGHGMLDKNLNYYYAPHDMNFERVRETGISFNEIINEMSLSKAQNKLLLMDTCHSGNTLDIDNYQFHNVNRELGERGSKAIKSDSNSEFKVSNIASYLLDDFISLSGITILSASSGQDVAFESNELSNGAFTTAYLDLLNKGIGPKYFNKLEAENRRVKFTNSFLLDLEKNILKHTNNKQKMNVRELNVLIPLMLW